MPDTLTVLAHPDPLRLDRELDALIRGAQKADPWARVLMLATTRRQVARTRRLLARGGARVGVEVMTHFGYAHRVLDAAGAPLSPAPRALLERLVEAALPEGTALREYAHGRPQAVAALVSALGELREAGVSPGDLRGARSPEANDLAALLEDYEARLARLAQGGQGWTDRAAIVRAATTVCKEEPPVARVIQIGAYELVRMNLELLRAIPADDRMLLAPVDPGAPAWKYARDALERLGTNVRALQDDGNVRPWVRFAQGLAGGEPIPEPPRVTLAHAQGPEAELTYVARRVLGLLEVGTAPEDIAIVARSLDPYVFPAESVFDRHGITVDSSGPDPLDRHPHALAFKLLVRAMVDGYDRQTVMDLVRSPVLRRPKEDPAWRPNSWDRWSRRYRIVRGIEAWRELPEEVSAGARQETDEEVERAEAWQSVAERLVAFLDELEDQKQQWLRVRTGEEHAAFLEKLGKRYLKYWDKPDKAKAVLGLSAGMALDRLKRVVTEVRQLDVLLSEGITEQRELSPLVVQKLLDVSTARETLDAGRPGSVRFVDLMQTRGLTAEHVFLIGFNRDFQPRPLENPLVPDALRHALRGRGHLLSVSDEQQSEEWLLLAQLVVSCTGALTVSWQRADGGGRELSVSTRIREFLDAAGVPSLADVYGDATEGVPTHPAEEAQWFLEHTGLVPLEDAAVAVGHAARNEAPTAVRKLLQKRGGDWLERLGPAVSLVEAIDRPGGDADDYDAMVGPGVFDGRFSATSLRDLGRCPQQFFFKRVLKIRPLDERAEETGFGALEVGLWVHEVLENALATIRGEGDPDPVDAAQADAVAGEAARLWDAKMDEVAQRMHRLPHLHRALQGSWREAMRAFVIREVRRLATEGAAIESLEHMVDDWIPLPHGAALLPENLHARLIAAIPPRDGIVGLHVKGVLDRVVRRPDGRVIADYKTMGNLKNKVDIKKLVNGLEIQAALYPLLLRADGETVPGSEMVGVGPDFLPHAGKPRPEPRAELTWKPTRQNEHPEHGFEESLLVLGLLAGEGTFPFSGHENVCQYCEFKPACRRLHEPTAERMKEHPAGALYQRLQRKAVSKPFLKDVK